MNLSLKLAELCEDLLDFLLLFSHYFDQKMVYIQCHLELVFIKTLFPLFLNTLGFLWIIVKFVNEVPDRLKPIFEYNFIPAILLGEAMELVRLMRGHECGLLSQKMFIKIQC